MPPVQHRFPFLDTLRGFAIAGILLVNVPDIVDLGRAVGGLRPLTIERAVLNYLVATRLVPIFAFMFGMSLVFMRDSARRRGKHAWPVLVRRLVALFLFGLLHMLVYPGEVLTQYAVVGLLVLPLVLRGSRAVRLTLGLVLTVASYALTGSSITNLPGLFLLGAAAVDWGWPSQLEAGRRPVVIAAVVAAVAAVPALVWQHSEPGDPRFTTAGGIAGGVMAILYVTALSLLWHTRVRRVLELAFAPLGRAAFTCYITASLIVAPAGALLGLTRTHDLRPALLIALGVLITQNLLVRLWFTKFSYGPLEWPWRAITWWTPMSKVTKQASTQPEPSN